MVMLVRLPHLGAARSPGDVSVKSDGMSARFQFTATLR